MGGLCDETPAGMDGLARGGHAVGMDGSVRCGLAAGMDDWPGGGLAAGMDDWPGGGHAVGMDGSVRCGHAAGLEDPREDCPRSSDSRASVRPPIGTSNPLTIKRFKECGDVPDPRIPSRDGLTRMTQVLVRDVLRDSRDDLHRNGIERVSRVPTDGEPMLPAREVGAAALHALDSARHGPRRVRPDQEMNMGADRAELNEPRILFTTDPGEKSGEESHRRQREHRRPVPRGPHHMGEFSMTHARIFVMRRLCEGSHSCARVRDHALRCWAFPMRLF